MIAAVMIGFLKRSKKKRVSNATSRDGGGAVGINVVCWINLKPREVVLCHAKVSRASGGSASREEDDRGIAEPRISNSGAAILRRIENNTLHHWVPANEALPATI